MRIIFQGKDGGYIKSWANVEYAGYGIPLCGDHVILHCGDECCVYFEEEVD